MCWDIYVMYFCFFSQKDSLLHTYVLIMFNIDYLDDGVFSICYVFHKNSYFMAT